MYTYTIQHLNNSSYIYIYMGYKYICICCVQQETAILTQTSISITTFTYIFKWDIYAVYSKKKHIYKYGAVAATGAALIYLFLT